MQEELKKQEEVMNGLQIEAQELSNEINFLNSDEAKLRQIIERKTDDERELQQKEQQLLPILH